ncbi:5-bromo-4-chloroindolyl phosphate hydrolysis family protein [Tropicimonas sp. IMCC6043]|uniref:5-bromo-4-chloroindolyl phosphate hydrolysis family protein n=1 Tax=Tropicimonas sp. IMCC6043 TaxID=2510645 RepID=UPI00101DEFD6|nr:5-bromo-4-chloroindolyl phosphate hydrolysis family protein [Tropicimonas sp. IMCC6043]RYH11164.1 hypothetical protein EU800_04700 [Tropicimonas sp. IMCC6043]
MRLPDGPRQVVAGLLAAAAFLGLYFGLSLVVWLALVLAVAVYAAALLLIGRRRTLEEINLGTSVSAADIQSAAATLQDAQQRLERAAGKAPEADTPAILDMASHVGSIRRSVLEDPEDYRPARRFITFYLPNIVKTVESYVKLAGQARGEKAARLHDLSGQIRRFGEVVERIDAACIENDLRALEVEVDVLSGQLDRVRMRGS